MLFSPVLAEEAASGLLVQPYWVLVSIVQFLLLVFLLQRFLWGPLLRTLAARATKIREGLDNAVAAKLEREQMTQQVAVLLADARREAAVLSERSTKAAEAAAADIREQARAEGDRIRERARADAEQLHRQSLAELRGEVASMAVLAASQILRREVDANAHRVLIERSIDEAGAELGRLS